MMIYESEITNLISSWKEKVEKSTDKAYCLAVRACIQETEEMLQRIHEEEENAYYKSLLDEEIADRYLSDMDQGYIDEP